MSKDYYARAYVCPYMKRTSETSIRCEEGAWLLVPQLAPFGFGLGVVADWALSLVIEGLKECDRERGKQEAYYKKLKK